MEPELNEEVALATDDPTRGEFEATEFPPDEFPDPDAEAQDTGDDVG